MPPSFSADLIPTYREDPLVKIVAGAAPPPSVGGLLLHREVDAIVPLLGHRGELAVGVHLLDRIVEQCDQIGLGKLGGEGEVLVVERLAGELDGLALQDLSLIHISEPTRLGMISYAVFCLKKKNRFRYASW